MRSGLTPSMSMVLAAAPATGLSTARFRAPPCRSQPLRAASQAGIARFHGQYPEAETATPVTDVADAMLPTIIDTDSLQLLLHFIATSGGMGLWRVDPQSVSGVLLALDPDIRPIGDVISLHERLLSSHGLVYAVRMEERRTLAQRNWQQVIMSLGNGSTSSTFVTCMVPS